jgi:tetratricopeptide (TPR) repeat protein
LPSAFCLLPFAFCLLPSAFCLLPSAFCLLPSSVALAQHQAPHQIPRVPQSLLEKPTTIRAGVGAVHDPMAGASPDAQRFYDLGLAYLHSYVWIEAARAFHQALRLDPALAAAQAAASVAYIELNQPDEARAALATAQRLAAGRSAHERRHVELRTLQAASEQAPANSATLAAYRAALQQASAEFPGDVEIAILKALATSDDHAERGQGLGGGAVIPLEAARSLAANHPGPHHYLTHALENAGRADEATAAAREYVRLAPEIPHAHHMLGHNLRRAGHTPDAIAEFEAADRLQRAYFARENLPASYDWHHAHNLDLLAQSYAYLGQMAKAEATYRASFDLPSNLLTQLFNKHEWPAFLRGRGRLDEALAAARVLVAHPHPLIQATGHIETGYVLAAKNLAPDAATAFNTALRMLRGNPEGAPLAADTLLALQGELALRTAARDKGRAILEEVVRRVRAKPGPDNWAQALVTLEAMARLARQVGDWELADRMARHMLQQDASYAGSHYALGLALDRAGDTAGARQAFQEAARLWSGADPSLPELADARKRGGVR